MTEASVNDISPREVWEYFHGDSAESLERKLAMQEMFSERFPHGHSTSIRDFALAYLDTSLHETLFSHINHDLDDIHPEALILLCQYGTDFEPITWGRGPYEQTKQPIWDGCYANSWYITLNDEQFGFPFRLDYVEGFYFNCDRTLRLHAWNTRREGVAKAYDWTLYPLAEWQRYYGVRFTQEEYLQLLEPFKGERNYISIFHKDFFPRTQPVLEELLTRRAKNPPL